MSGYEIQDEDGTMVYEGETFMECVEVARTKEFPDGYVIVAILVRVGDL